MDPDATYVPESAVGADPEPLVAGRYVVGPLVGRGGGGQVHRATDTFTGETVALKLVKRDGKGASSQLRRELTALRLVDLPGVVRLRDDGEHENFVFLVMDWLGGGRFDSLAERGWAGWRDAAIALLEAVGRLHFLGLVHGDLKPGNILLNAAGQPVVADFGLASGEVVADHDASWVAGTPRYMAPEQSRGEVLDARADLYALGVMFEEMGGPPEVMALFRQMCAEAREDRPASMEAVLAALGADDGLVGTFDMLPETVDEAELRALFGDGPTFLHIAEDAARLVLERTDGSRGEVSSELARWVRAGRCHRDGDQLVMERAAVDRLRWERQPTDLSVEAAVAAHHEGQTRRGLAILAALGDRSEAAEAATVDLALSLWSAAAIRNANYQAERRGWKKASRVLMAAGAFLTGNRDAVLEFVGPANEDSGVVEGWRLAVGIGASLRTAAVEDWLAAASRWAVGDPIRQARLDAWRARVAYSRGAFGDALGFERRALSAAHVPVVRLSRLTNAASAALETGSIVEASEWAQEALELARTMRHAAAEARAWWLLRSVALRSGKGPAADPSWVEPAMSVSRTTGALLALTEAALAWRDRDETLAGRLALCAMNASGGSSALADLCRALAWRCGCADPPQSLGGGAPELELQTWTLCIQGGLRLGDPPEVEPSRLENRWLDVIPGAECLDAVQRLSKSDPSRSSVYLG